MITLSVAEFLRRWVAVAGVAGGLPGSVSPATTATRWVSLPIRENSCHSWFHLKAWFFREEWRIFNHEWARMGRGRSITAQRSITDRSLYLLCALKNAYLKEQGVPELRDIWIQLHYGGEPKSKGKSKLVT